MTRIRFQLERLLFSAVLFLARLMPRAVLLAVGNAFGSLAYFLDRRHRKVAFQNHETAFPEMSLADRKRIIRNCYRFFGMYLFDMLTYLARGFPPERARDFEWEGLDHVDAAYARGKGVIFFTGHLGAWEVMAIAHGHRGYSLGVVARALDNPYLEMLLKRFRTSTGNFVIEKQEGFRPMLKAMREGKGVAILIDQNVTTEERIFVDFFGIQASSTPAVGLIKLKTDCALIPVFALPLERHRYRFIYGAPVEVSLSGNRSEDALSVTQECTTVLEGLIRKYPEYWLWMHRRWKTRPETG